MFMSLNKKFMYVFFFFFLLVISLFLGFFELYYEQNTKVEEQRFIDTSARFIEIAYNNSYLSNHLRQAIDEGKIVADSHLERMLRSENNEQNKKIIESLNNIYNKKYDQLGYLWQFFGISLLWISVSVIILWFLLRYMVLRPVNQLIYVSEEVSKGNFQKRAVLTDKKIKDEFFVLGQTFNQMLQNIEENILKIKNNQYFLQSIIDAIPDGLRIMDSEGKIILANRAYMNLLGVKKCDGEYCFRQSMRIKNLCPENKMKCPLREFQKKDTFSLSTVQYFVNDPNRPISIKAAKMPIKEGEAKKEYIIEALRDLSGEIKFSHQQKISSLAFLATSVAHEMKNNLGALRMIMEQILENKNFQNKEEEKYFKFAYNQVLENIKIPESLLNLAKNSAENRAKVRLNDVVKSVCALLDYEAKRKGVEIVVSIDDKMELSGNEPDFKMIFLNLGQNAIKAMPNGGKLEIVASVNKNKAEVEVKDTGIGIEKSRQKRVFEPFYSFSENSEGGHGTGIGLSIVKSLVESFGGKITLKSRINKGTTFTMSFPLKK